MDKPLIIEIHLIIDAQRWKIACAKVLALLKSRICRDFSLLPLYINSDIEDTELRICVQTKSPEKLGGFISQEIRKIKGVESARVRLTLEGKIFPKGVSAFATTEKKLLSCHVFIDSAAGKDEYLWRKISRLKKDGSVLPVWIFRDFYEYGRSITLRVIGKKEKPIRKYVEKYLGNMPGVKTWQLRFTHNSIRLLSKTELLKIAQNWFLKYAKITKNT